MTPPACLETLGTHHPARHPRRRR